VGGIIPSLAGGQSRYDYPVSDVISDYQKWKQQGEELQIQAKAAMETRFRELLLEAVKVAEEYKSDFRGVLKPPPAVTAFRYRAAASKNAKKKKAAAAPAPLPTTPVKKPDRKVLGSPTRNLDDKVYEIEDALQSALRS
jgi:hypothetical protein